MVVGLQVVEVGGSWEKIGLATMGWKKGRAKRKKKNGVSLLFDIFRFFWTLD